MNNLSPFCTCEDRSCPFNPMNHDKGCSLCIAKNLKLREIPNCFFNLVDPEYKGAEYHFEDFAKCVKESRIVIRPVEPEEIVDVAALMAINWKTTYRGILSDGFLESLAPDFFSKKWEKYITEERHGILVAHEKDVFLGFAAYKPDEEIDNCLYLDSLHVGVKGRGTGTKLIIAIAKKAREFGYSKVSVNVASGNDRAKHLYEKLGAEHYSYIPDDDFYGEKAASETLIWDRLGTIGAILSDKSSAS